MKALETSIEAEIAMKGDDNNNGCNFWSTLKLAWNNIVFRRGVYAGITVQIAQQFSGINSVMYYSPTIVQLAGYASNKTAMALSLITTGLNTLGTLISMSLIDKFGRRKLMMVSMVGIISCLCVLSLVFYEASSHSPAVSFSESTHFGTNSTCTAFANPSKLSSSSSSSSSWTCTACLKASSDCAFCSNTANKVSFLSFIYLSSLLFIHLLSSTLSINIHIYLILMHDFD